MEFQAAPAFDVCFSVRFTVNLRNLHFVNKNYLEGGIFLNSAPLLQKVVSLSARTL